MDYFLTEEQQMIVETAWEITREKILPVRAELDEKNEFATDVLKDMARADLFSIFVPEEYGGFGGGCFETVLAMEQLARGRRGLAPRLAASAPAQYPSARTKYGCVHLHSLC